MEKKFLFEHCTCSLCIIHNRPETDAFYKAAFSKVLSDSSLFLHTIYLFIYPLIFCAIETQCLLAFKMPIPIHFPDFHDETDFPQEEYMAASPTHTHT